ncbi:MAG: hypothetical protein AAGC92_12685 [Pseudomonadota bacterium]
MSAAGALSTWIARAAVLMLAALFLALALSPAGLAAGRLPMPDPVFALLFICRLRRPEIMPLGLLIALSLVSDLIRGAPLGVGTLAMLAAAEVLLRYRDRILRGGFGVEWLLAACLFGAQMTAQYLLLSITFAPRPSLSALAISAGMTILSYPCVFLVLRGMMPMRPNQTGALGRL